MNIYNKKIGIWGFGIVGKSVTTFLHRNHHALQVMDKRALLPEEEHFLKSKSISFVHEDHREGFLAHNDLIIPSAGIDLRAYQQYRHKFVNELDLFSTFFSKPIIAITGTLGKTTLTNLLSTLLISRNYTIAMGGNIGVGLCDFIDNQAAVDYAVLEVSSFQLELAKTFAPALAIWTNFYPNHLDRHSALDDYFTAKANIVRHQHAGQQSLIPLSLLHMLQDTLGSIPPEISFFSLDKPLSTLLTTFKHNRFFWIEDNHVICTNTTNEKNLILAPVPQGLFIDTALILSATLNLLDLSCTISPEIIKQGASLEHRLENVITIQGVTFYNDSKATVPEATLAAVNTLQPGPILLLLGGLSKGVNRKPFIQQLHNKIFHAFCFGAEASQLAQWCLECAIPASAFKTLQEALTACIQQTKPGDTVLLSPGGSSFDLFANYQERGTTFKNLIISK